MVESVQFYPYDLNYRVENGVPVIQLFSTTKEGKQICVRYKDFKPYFYVIAKDGADIREQLLKSTASRFDTTYKITNVEPVEKELIGKKVAAYKAFTEIPAAVPAFRDVITRMPNVQGMYEHDILFVRRFLIDHHLLPMSLCEARGSFVDTKLRVPCFEAEAIKPAQTDGHPEPKILAVDIETYTPSTMEISMDKNPILMIAFYGKNYKKVITYKKFNTDHDYIDFVSSEKELLEQTVAVIKEFKPDIVTGYFSDGFDFPYIKARAEKLKVKIDIAADGSELKINRLNDTSAEILGIPHLDVFKFIRKIMFGQMHTDSYSLDAVSKELLGAQKIEVDLNELSLEWDKGSDRLNEFAEYNLRDTELTYQLAEKLMPNVIEMARISALPVFDINRMGFSQLIEWYLLRQAPEFNQIAPNKPSNDELMERRRHSVKGGFVFEPKPGLYHDLVIYDYRSLYPTIIASHNIGPETIGFGDAPSDARAVPLDTSSKKLWFPKTKQGFIPVLIENLITKRMELKKGLKDATGQKKAILLAQQNSLKLLANSFYGYLGFYGARWYCLDCAESTTAFGRHYIKQVIAEAEKTGFAVRYSDTDSVFLALEGKSQDDAKGFVKTINDTLPGLMELEFEGYYPAGIFVSAKAATSGAKKKYALLAEDNTLVVKGFESVRRNWSRISKDVQEHVLMTILKDNDPEKANEYVKKIISGLRKHTIPKEKVVMKMQLQKDLADYDAKGPHVAAALRMQEKGIHVGPGTLITYIVTQGEGIIRNRVKLPDEVSQEDYDAEYYINNQVIPAVERILAVYGHSKETLAARGDQKNLSSFFG